jgi:hypothetical protein
MKLMPPEPIDKLGMPIRVGDPVAYGHALGRCAGIRVGKVVDIKYRGKDHNDIDLWSISVWGVDDDWAPMVYSKQHWDPKIYGAHLNDKRGTLQFPERMIVLKWGQLKPEVAKMLTPVNKNYKLPPEETSKGRRGY